MRGTLAVVVTMVDLTPRPAKTRAKSTMGIIWPGARKGKKKMWRSMASRREDKWRRNGEESSLLCMYEIIGTQTDFVWSR
ncbi:hypothetical protein C4D60_Mb06t28150 [Musa balbisiana]|uniref:Uncharacterized protein n=1 Tax=Musa balbisiana TaxID=52838 RepID=A0A4V4H479_MUSBA|nr:hypothetical protein C4D60_Mb06t28150 [Musa balbisiana]